MGSGWRVMMLRPNSPIGPSVSVSVLMRRYVSFCWRSLSEAMSSSISLCACSSSSESSMRVLMYIKCAAIVMNSLATSRSSCFRCSRYARYWSRISATGMSWISILFFDSRKRMRSSGPSKSCSVSALRSCTTPSSLKTGLSMTFLSLYQYQYTIQLTRSSYMR